LAQILADACRREQLALRVLTLHQLLPELAAEIALPNIEAVIFADARAIAPDDDSPAIQITPVPLRENGRSVGHHLTPATLLLYAQALFHRCPPAWLVTIPGENFDHGETFSATTGQALASATAILPSLIAQLRPAAAAAAAG